MAKLIGNTTAGAKRTFEPDFPKKRNPWDAETHPTNYLYIDNIIRVVDALDNRPAKYPPEVRIRVYQLRDEGFTLREIASEVKISKSTACLYLKNRDETEIPKEVYEIFQPGTSNKVEREVTIRQVSLGQLKPSGSVKKLKNETI